MTSHQGEGSSIGGCKLNGLNVGSYEVIPGSRVGGVIGSLDAVPAHEYLHTYDALDLYRKVPSNSLEKPAAYWDIMADGTENGKRKLPTMLQQTGVTVSIFAAIGAAIGTVAAIVAAIRKRK